MAKDFLTSQVRTSQIIASRSLPSTPSLYIISASNADGIGGISPPLGAGSDTFLFISGSKGTDAYSVFGGSVKVSGSLIVNEGLTGSLQRTAGGLPYLVAGSNITLATSSNGQITITSTGGGGGSPGAPTDSIQFNDGTNFAGSSNLTWVNGTNSLYVTGALYLKGNEYRDGTTFYNNFGSEKFIYINDDEATIVVEDQANGINGRLSVFSGEPEISLNDNGGFGFQATVSSLDSDSKILSYGPIDLRIDSDQTVYIGSGSATNVVIAETGTPTLIKDQLTVLSNVYVTGSVLPGSSTTYNLGSPDKRWANVYTGDLHLKNDRGSWSIVEERDYLTITNNLSGKRYKFVLEEI
jgi:hypothetical protein